MPASLAMSHERADAAMASIACHLLEAPCAELGRAIVRVKSSPFPPSIMAGDLLCVDFTVTRLLGDSLYIIEFLGNGEPLNGPWIGIRRFQKMPSGWVMSDDDANAPRRLMPQSELDNMRVIGHVTDIYQSQNRRCR